MFFGQVSHTCKNDTDPRPEATFLGVHQEDCRRHPGRRLDLARLPCPAPTPLALCLVSWGCSVEQRKH